MDRHHRLSDLATAYDLHAHEREERGEPEWREPIRAEFAGRLPPGGKLLEVGAGVGYSAAWFAGQGFDVVATDLSPENVAHCRAKGVPAEVRDMADLGFPDDTFDGVWAASCLMHVPDAELGGVLAELRRVLVPGGLMWAGTWGGLDREGIWDEDWYQPARFYSLRSDERIVEAYRTAGFEVVDFAVIDPEPTIAWRYQMATLQAPRRD